MAAALHAPDRPGAARSCRPWPVRGSPAPLTKPAAARSALGEARSWPVAAGFHVRGGWRPEAAGSNREKAPFPATVPGDGRAFHQAAALARPEAAGSNREKAPFPATVPGDGRVFHQAAALARPDPARVELHRPARNEGRPASHAQRARMVPSQVPAPSGTASPLRPGRDQGEGPSGSARRGPVETYSSDPTVRDRTAPLRRWVRRTHRQSKAENAASRRRRGRGRSASDHPRAISTPAPPAAAARTARRSIPPRNRTRRHRRPSVADDPPGPRGDQRASDATARPIPIGASRRAAPADPTSRADTRRRIQVRPPTTPTPGPTLRREPRTSGHAGSTPSVHSDASATPTPTNRATSSRTGRRAASVRRRRAASRSPPAGTTRSRSPAPTPTSRRRRASRCTASIGREILRGRGRCRRIETGRHPEVELLVVLESASLREAGGREGAGGDALAGGRRHRALLVGQIA